ncbi:MAG: cellulase family glycosylhydrolase [Melioribacteraceae bacterium]|nr:cellulase family glycosylhydrolase [Melioribacteraceae bacterium]
MKLKYTLLISMLMIFQLFAARSFSYSIQEKKLNEEKTQSALSKSIINIRDIKIDSIPPDNTDMRDISSIHLSRQMVPGWNVGNSLESIGGETAWGNPKISIQLIDSLKAAGFKAVRIPVAWSRFSNAAEFEIEQSWLNRVEEVVNYVLSNGMYAIINEHWDNGWIQPTYAKEAEVKKRLAAMWKQIAIHFRDYDDRLLFAGTNEVMVTNNYGTPIKEYYTVQNGYNQTFVNTVRSTGGRNHYRFLLVQGFNTNIDHTINYFIMPKDVILDRLMVEVHYYDPYNFTLNSNSTITQWGKNATDSKKTETWANETWANNQFNKMKTKFVDKGIAVILGEYGAIARTNLGTPELNAEHAQYRKYYIEFITGSIVKHGLVPFYWDNGGTGNYGLGIFNRLTGAKAYPEIVKAVIDAANLNTGIGKFNEEEIPNSFSLFQNYPNPFNPVTTIKFTIPSGVETSYMTSLRVYDIFGREIAVLVNEETPPGIYEVKFSLGNYENASLSSSIYFYKLHVGDFTQVKKMVYLK